MADHPPPTPESQSSSFLRDPSNAIPRLESYRFHSAILPDPEHRAVLVYLPREYDEQPHRNFPVLYLHDGQNLFDERTAFIPGHPWHAHTTADQLVAEGAIEPLILAGIANSGLRRIAEYTPSRDPKHGGGEGDRYGRLLLEEIKPFVDRNYRTLPRPEHTGLGGSSLGGLISLYLGLQHPDVFRKLAVMSPSLWWDQRSLLALAQALVERFSPRPPLRIWLDMGMDEGLRHLRDTDQLFQIFQRLGWRPGVNLRYERIAGAGHNEDAWSERFGDVLKLLYPRNPHLTE